LEITVPPGRSTRNPLAKIHRADVKGAKKGGIPVTKPARMVADLARTVPPELLAEAVDDVLCRRLARLDQLVGGAGGGGRRLQRVLDAWNGDGALPGSAAEMALVRALLEAGLAAPVRQYWIAAAHARVDLAYPDDRIAIELDSFRWHAGKRPFDADRARGNRIVAAGWQLLRATPTDAGAAVSAAAQLVRRVA
jgi:very-short-patch-repair endonuclease